ncbi:MAG: ATP-binding cassette domain-containing protein [Acidobacteria bacterium]|nr:ATP-binding cassette domain-containing protein [Acidobacteriota bacterium]
MADLTVQDLRVVRDGRPVLDGCAARFPGGRRTVLWGRSGAGKSTLLHSIAGLVAPEAGTIQLGDEVLFSRSAGVDRPPHTRGVGFVFQDLALWPHLSALEQVELVGRGAALDREGAISLLDSVGLGSLASRRPGQLSGGEQQRLAIARALAGRAALLILDEPFSSVDRGTRLALHKLLRELSPRVPGPTIYVTHSSEDARALAENVLSLEGGRLVASERPWEGQEDQA